MFRVSPLFVILLLVAGGPVLAQQPSAEQLAGWLEQFPDADLDKDGRLSIEEARSYQKKRRGGGNAGRAGNRGGAKREFSINPGWEADRFPEHAACYRSPEEIKALYAGTKEGARSPVTSFPKPPNGALRIVGTGHSFMAPGYKVLPLICRAAGFEQPLHLHTGGGMTGSARYKWEQENGIFQFEGQPKPKLLASIANAEWEAMMWGPYFKDRPDFYRCWVEFCLKHNPGMKFYLSDAWPQLEDLDGAPKSEKDLTAEAVAEIGRKKNAFYAGIVDTLNGEFPGKVFILPTCDAMVLATEAFHRGELPGIMGVNRALGGKERSLWRDKLGHLGPGLERLEGYVFYSTLYRRSPELIEKAIGFPGKDGFPNPQLDRAFRRIAWKAVTGNRLSGVTDKDGDGVGD